MSQLNIYPVKSIIDEMPFYYSSVADRFPWQIEEVAEASSPMPSVLYV